MSMPAYQAAVYDVATTCACLRRRKQCKHNFNDIWCGTCKWYCKRYMPTSPAPAKEAIDLYMIQAENRAELLCQHDHVERNLVLLALFIIACIVGMFVWAYYISH